MAGEVAGFEMVQGPVENGAEEDKSILHEKEIGKLERDSEVSDSTIFSSHTDESSAAEENGVSDSSGSKNTGEEGPAPQKIHSFYFIRLRRYDDPNIKPEMDKLDKEMNQKNQIRIQLTDAIREKRSKRAELNSQIKPLQSILDEKRKEIESLQQALAKLRTTNNAGRGGLCSSEEELKNIIYILREIKQLEGTRDKIIANAALRAEVQNFVWKKEAIQDQVELVSGELNGMKKDRQAVRSKIKKLDDALKAIDNDILSLEEEKVTVTQKREKAFESIQHLRRKRDEGNASFYQSRRIMTKAKDLAAEKDINALQELSHKEVEKFMSHWNSDRTFRDDYVKRLLQSLDIRQLSRDGRMRNPDEKPLMEEPKPNENNTSPNRSVKQGKEEALLAQKVQKVTKNKGRYLKSKLDNENLEDTDEYEFENSHKETSVVETAVDPEKLKEIKRVEEIAKAKRALERKKKLAEKAVAKAAKKAQMEAVKKLKGRDKKAKKETDEVVEATEKENVNDNVIEDSAPVKEKVQKESRTKYAGRSKCPEAIPKVIIKRKKSKNLWISFTIFACLVMVMSMLALHSLSLDI